MIVMPEFRSINLMGYSLELCYDAVDQELMCDVTLAGAVFPLVSLTYDEELFRVYTFTLLSHAIPSQLSLVSARTSGWSNR